MDKRGFGKAIVMAMALFVGPPAAAQTAPARPTNLPKAPVPYTKLAPKPHAAATPAAPAAPAAPPARPASGQALATGRALSPTDVEAFVDGWISQALRDAHTPGATVAVVQNGQVVLKKGYGFADLAPRRPVDPDATLFRLGPVSTLFTWTLVMREVEAGRMRLDRPVNLYLPEKVRLPGRGRNVMLGQLMDHSAGFDDRTLGRFVEDNPRRVRPLELYLRENRPAIVRTPGLLSSYANYGPALAGEAVSLVSGETFERRAESQIFEPLGMTRTTFREPRDDRRGLPAPMPAALKAQVAQGYAWRDAGFMPDGYEFLGQVAPAAGASSTAADMARFMRVLLAEGRTDTGALYGPATARAFVTPMRRTPTGINGWAHGFATFALPGGYDGFGQAGGTIAFHASLVVVPKLGLGVFVATNGETGGPVVDGLAEALVRHFYAPTATWPRLGASSLVGQGLAYDGAYLSTRRAYGGLEGFVDLLRRGVKVRVTSGGRLVTEGADGLAAWVPDGAAADSRFVSTTSDERLAFNRRDSRAWSFERADGKALFERAALWERPAALLTLAALAAAAAIGTLIGALLRDRRELRQNVVQARAGLVQNIQAGLWLTAFGLFAAWWAQSGDPAALMYGWPGPLVVTASACALVAAALTLVTFAALPSVWQGGRRVDSWTGARKAFFTLTVLIYLALSVTLALGGALEPWSG